MTSGSEGDGALRRFSDNMATPSNAEIYTGNGSFKTNRWKTYNQDPCNQIKKYLYIMC